jgi:diguanylate cyclase (GGDEF)-like protein
MDQYDEADAIQMDELHKKTYALERRKLEENAEEYCSILLNNISEIEQSLTSSEKNQDVKMQAVYFGFLFFYLMIGVVYSLLILYQYYNTDALTLLGNRTMYERMRGRLEKSKTSYYLLILDIDNFKNVNDTYGHKVGDDVLHKLGQVIKSSLNGKSYVYRYGGEEISVVMIQSSKEICFEMSEQIRRNIETINWENGMKITVSGGLSKGENGENPFLNADRALYMSKSSGKNKITIV